MKEEQEIEELIIDCGARAVKLSMRYSTVTVKLSIAQMNRMHDCISNDIVEVWNKGWPYGLQ